MLGIRYSDFWAEENLESTGDSDTDGACVCDFDSGGITHRHEHSLSDDEKEALEEDMRKERHLMRRRMKLPLSERRQIVSAVRGSIDAFSRACFCVNARWFRVTGRTGIPCEMARRVTLACGVGNVITDA